MLIGEKIQKLRKANFLTQEELGKIINTDGNTVSRWERNKLGVGSSYIAKLAKALNTTTDYLLGETEAPGENENQKSEHIYKKEVDEKKEAEDFSYWGGVVNNARRVAEHGDAKEITLITPLLKTAYEMLSGVNVSEEKPGQKLQLNNVGQGTLTATLH